jgi:DNA-binding NarL/FixJ family response regulator
MSFEEAFQRFTKAARDAARQPALTPREREVVALVAVGRTNQQIAGTLVISERTVESHVSNALYKLGATSRASLVAWAVEHKLAAAFPR